jgi:hypothetical protein
MITKRTSKDGRKTWQYEYKQFLVKPEVFEMFRTQAKESGLTYSEYLTKLLTQKPCECPSGK